MNPTVVRALRNRLADGGLDTHTDRVAELVDELVAVRTQRQLSETAIRSRMGGNSTSVDRVELRRGARKFATILRYAHAVGARVHVTVTTHDGVEAPETVTRVGESTHLSQIQAALVAIREEQGLDHLHMAKALGWTAKDIRRTEERDDLLMSTLCRHAVVLGANLTFSVHVVSDVGDSGDQGRVTTKTGRLVDRIAEDMIDRIEAGEWPRGAHLPTQSALCGEYACSSEAVRDVLSTLRALGYVTARHGDRARVRDRSHDADLPTALADLATSVDEIRTEVGAAAAQQLGEVRRRLDQLAGVARDQQARVLEPLTQEMRDKHVDGR